MTQLIIPWLQVRILLGPVFLFAWFPHVLRQNLRQEVLSVAFVVALAAKAGFKVQKIDIDDDSVDIMIMASGKIKDDSKLKSPSVEIQLKATTKFDIKKLGQKFNFQVKKKNYEELRGEYFIPRYLCVLLLPKTIDEMVEQGEDYLSIRHKMFWLDMKNFPEFPNRRRKGKPIESTSVEIPTCNIFNVEILTGMLYAASKREEFKGNA